MLFNDTPCKHPIIIIKDMSYNHLKILIEFMYYGEVNISQDQLPIILKAAESLQIKGLAEKSNLLGTPQSIETEYSLLSPSSKRKKMHLNTSSDRSENNSSLDDAPAKTEQSNLAIRSQPVAHGHESSKSISSCSSSGGISKQSPTENATVNQKSSEVTKRVKTLVRQPHLKINDYEIKIESNPLIKKESSEEPEPIIRVLERQCSEPNPSSTNMLAVPKQTIVKQNSQPSEPTNLSRGYLSDELSLSITQTIDTYNGSTRSDHCPLLRTGPALGCSFCWNTIDTRGRFLRRKTKYHCPECNINLCLVPCFQEFHEKQTQTKLNDSNDDYRSQKTTIEDSSGSV
ncbi:protein bric-a-brac 2-like isoform X3 [Daktulosphaira vitifoliae]|nr:protein bric-a-brac 2-like isoform X3 [Daktulosphaira vitifoliae]